MGEHGQSVYIPHSDQQAGQSGLAIPPQVLARWAALASARASLATLPRQVR